ALIEKNRILESIDDGFFTVDRYWIVTYWNRRAEKIFNIPRFEIVGKNLWDLFNESNKAELYTAFHNAVQYQIKTQFEEFLSEIDSWLEFVIYPTEDGLSVYFKNINDRKESENKMNELNRSLKAQTKELEISNAELEQFAYVASHDLQEPLRMITSFLNQIEKKYSDKLDERGKQYIQFVTDGANRMRQIILDLLEFSKIGSMDRVRKKIDMNKVLERAILSNKNRIESKKVNITTEKLPEIFASEIQMHQLLQNLISNAIKYQKKENIPMVHIKFKESEQHWIFSIKDNGIGIDSEYKSRIFEIFQRLHGNNEYSGTGIGLAICKKIVEEHKGEIWFESEIGKGSVFYFTIRKDQHLYS
ncbi:MAG: ATP-binding protein, partial [Candidatus Paceibacterota bacterium]